MLGKQIFFKSRPFTPKLTNNNTGQIFFFKGQTLLIAESAFIEKENKPVKTAFLIKSKLLHLSSSKSRL